MNRLRWIFGIPLAFIAIIAVLMLNTSIEVYMYRSPIYSWIDVYYHSFVMLVCCSLFVFLRSLFVPTKRKYAAVIAVLIMSCLAAASLIFTFLERETYGDITIRFILGYAAIFSGLLVGICISYQVFKNRGWSKVKIEEEIY